MMLGTHLTQALHPRVTVRLGLALIAGGKILACNFSSNIFTISNANLFGFIRWARIIPSTANEWSGLAFGCKK